MSIKIKFHINYLISYCDNMGTSLQKWKGVSLPLCLVSVYLAYLGCILSINSSTKHIYRSLQIYNQVVSL